MRSTEFSVALLYPEWPVASGEMGGRIRALDWSSTPLGPLDGWSDRLRGKIDLLLLHHSPMVALIGPDLVQIYNDPYRDLMGTRHPAGLGQPTRECWPEVWHINQPIYHAVLGGEAVAFDDKLFPIVRDGITEDAWFSITYSPLNIAGNGTDGVLVTTVETSAKVRAESVRVEAERRLTEVRDLAGLTSDFRALFEGAPTPLLVIAPDTLTIVAANHAYRAATLTTDAEILGKPLFGVFPDDPTDADADGMRNLRASIEQVVATGAPHTMAVQLYPVRRSAEHGGGFEERWWDCVNSPLKGPDGSVALIIHGASDVTSSHHAQIALRESEERQAFLLKLSDALRPLSDAIEVQDVAARVLGEHLGVTRAMFGDLDQDEDVIHYQRSYVAAGEAPILGRFRTSEFAASRANAYRKGVPIRFDDAAAADDLDTTEKGNFAALNIAGLISAPLVKDGRLIAAVTVATREPRLWSDADVATVQATVERTWEAVQRTLAEARLRESEAEYRQLFDSTHQGFCVIEKIAKAPGEPSDFLFVAANPAYERLTGLHDVIGRTVLELMPGYETPTMDILDEVVATGQRRLFEPFISDLGSWFEIEAVPGQHAGQIAVLFSNTTVRKQAEAALREVSDSRSFLLLLSDSIRELVDPAAIQGTACRLLGERLGTDRAYYLEIDPRSDHTLVRQDYVRDDALPSLVGKWPLATFGYILPLYQPGLPVLIPDVLTFDAMPETAKQQTVAAGVRSYLCVPLVKEGELSGALIVADNNPREWTQAEAGLVDEVAQRIWASVERGRAQIFLRDSEARQRALIEGVPQLVWRSDGDGNWIWSSPQWTEYTGLSEAESRGHGWMRAVHPDDRQLARGAWTSDDLGGALSTEVRLCKADGKSFRWSAFRARPRRGDDGAIVEWLGTATDINDLRLMQDAQQVMVAELQHRTRNLIAIVRSVAQQTLRGSTSLPQFQTHFDDRLGALSRVQGLLSRSNQEPITLRSIIQMELDALSALSFGDRVQLDGPEVPLRNAIVQTLSLVLHELATNARKYGALATDHGTLKVKWQVGSDGNGGETLAIDWLENGLDPAREIKSVPTTGYGRQLIERALPYTLHAKTRLEFGDDEVLCSIELPLGHHDEPVAIH